MFMSIINYVCKIIFLIFLTNLTLFASTDNSVKIGIVLNDIYNFKLNDDKYSTDFYIWYRWSNDKYKPYETMELINGDIVSKHIVEQSKGYMLQRIKATIREDFNGGAFPLDAHRFKIIFEDSFDTRDGMQIVIDTNNSILDLNTKLQGYDIKEFSIVKSERKYNTNFGAPNTHQDVSYNRFEINVDISRSNASSFVRTFWVYFISILVASVAFLIRPDNTARFSLAIGAIFAAATNNIIIKNLIPEEANWTLADKIGFLTLFSIFMTIVLSAISLRLYYNQKQAVSKKLDKISFVAMLCFYIICMTYFVKTSNIHYYL